MRRIARKRLSEYEIRLERLYLTAGLLVGALLFIFLASLAGMLLLDSALCSISMIATPLVGGLLLQQLHQEILATIARRHEWNNLSDLTSRLTDTPHLIWFLVQQKYNVLENRPQGAEIVLECVQSGSESNR